MTALRFEVIEFVFLIVSAALAQSTDQTQSDQPERNLLLPWILRKHSKKLIYSIKIIEVIFMGLPVNA
jgi:glycerol-3-phosphate responsive antiterminator